jgi:hypothetical protein
MRRHLIPATFQLSQDVDRDLFVRLHMATRHVSLEGVIQLARGSEIERLGGKHAHELGKVDISPYSHLDYLMPPSRWDALLGQRL